jgi:hypothetical protein
MHRPSTGNSQRPSMRSPLRAGRAGCRASKLTAASNSAQNKLSTTACTATKNSSSEKRDSNWPMAAGAAPAIRASRLCTPQRESRPRLLASIRSNPRSRRYHVPTRTQAAQVASYTAYTSAPAPARPTTSPPAHGRAYTVLPAAYGCVQREASRRPATNTHRLANPVQEKGAPATHRNPSK